MIRAFNFLDRIFGAATYAEANCHNHARNYLDLPPSWAYTESTSTNYHFNWKTKLENTFCAVAYAEANCPDMAMEFNDNQNGSRQQDSLKDFLEITGLSRVPVYYGSASLQYVGS